MLRKYSTILGIGLLMLWAVGLGSPGTYPWMTWLVGIAALCSFGIAAFTPTYASRNTKMGESVLLATGLFLLWVVGLVNGVAPWMAWWTFAFACVYLLLGIVVGLAGEKTPPMAEIPPHRSTEQERERFRKGA
ncbi:MAG: hypothetical protein ABIQ95_11950 [Bdellovibrionia bacterium]